MSRIPVSAVILTLLAACADNTGPAGVPLQRQASFAQGDGGVVVFHSRRAGNADIYLMRGDGGAQSAVTTTSANEQWPDISPDGRFVTFARTVGGTGEIYVLDLASGIETNLSNSTADDNWPRFSPNGHEIAFHSNRDGNYEIYVVDADGGGTPRRVTNNALLDQWPDWSPDGKSLAFRRGTNIWVIDADGEEQNPRQLTNLTSINQMAVWSPNGKQIAFMSLREGYPSVFLMSADGETAEDPAVNLTPKPAADAASAWLSRAPAWSRNGQQIYFMSFRPETSGDVELFVMNADGTEATRLTAAAGEDGGPQLR